MDYVKPELVDYGTLEELTAAIAPAVGEDAGGKTVSQFHASAPQ